MDLSQQYALPTIPFSVMVIFLHAWNRSGRSASWAQSTKEVVSRAGVSRDAFARARNKLAQCGLIEFEKGGRHTHPKYRLGPAFSVLQDDTESDTEQDTDSDTKPDTYQRRGREEENIPPDPPPENDLQAIASKIASLVEEWSPKFNSAESHELMDNAGKWSGLSADDWAVLTAWYAAPRGETTRFRAGKLKLLTSVDTELEKAREAGFSASSAPASGGPSWLPTDWREIASEVTGEDCSGLESHRDVPLDFRGDFERACRYGREGES